MPLRFHKALSQGIMDVITVMVLNFRDVLFYVKWVVMNVEGIL